MAKISLPVEKTNEAIKDGRLENIMKRTEERWHPEGIYFANFDGQRTAFMVFDLSDSSEMPPFAEPFFMELGADVQIAPVMNKDDLRKGISQLSSRGSS